MSLASPPRRPSDRPRSPAAPRRGTLAVALLCLLAQVASFAHLALVRHTSCPEHDDLVHAAEGTTSPEAGGPQGTAAPGVQMSSADPAAHEDDHCLVAALRRRDEADRGDAGHRLAPVRTADALRPTLPPAGVPAPIAILRLAPKSSPPLLPTGA